MVVTATKYETAIKDVPASVTVISATELAEQNMPNSDIADALRSVPGITVRRAYAPFPASANIRGAGSDGTVYLVNGIPTDWQISQTIAVELVQDQWRPASGKRIQCPHHGGLCSGCLENNRRHDHDGGPALGPLGKL